MKILVGMSGGVDSSFAAAMLIEQGNEVEGAYLVMHEHAEPELAISAAETLGIPMRIIDCRGAFDSVVRSNFVSEYKNGRTPNPCIICNPLVKFAALRDEAKRGGFDAIATGHYARVHTIKTINGEEHAIGVAKDVAKDQSYMLYRLGEDILSLLVLPLSETVKSDMRDNIRGSELSSFDRKDSQEICFLPNGGYAEYIEAVSGECPRGYFVSPDGKRLGEHKGIIRYTLGQRKGLGVSLGERAFVTDIDPVANTVCLDIAPKMSKCIKVEGLHLSSAFGEVSGRYDVKIRYAAKPAPATVVACQGGAEIIFDEPQRSVTPGQSAVFYRGGIVVGGGFICK